MATLFLVPEGGTAVELQSCRCGHVQVAHEHYRRGKDCALCECGRYRRGPR